MPEPKPPRTGPCGAYRCDCPGFVPGLTVGIWPSCVRCTHAQAGHEREETKP